MPDQPLPKPLPLTLESDEPAAAKLKPEGRHNKSGLLWRMVQRTGHSDIQIPYTSQGETGLRAMNADLALISDAAQKQSVLARLHSWSAPTLTHGKTQSLGDPQLTTLEASGIDVVRRPTGGGWLLHLAGDLAATLAVPGPLRPGDLRGAARAAAEWLVRGLIQAGLPASVAEPETSHATREAVCFQRVDRDEVLVDGIKVAGVALARRAEGALVQCAVPLSPVPDKLSEIVRAWDPQRERAVGVLASRGLDFAALSRALIDQAQGADVSRS